MNICDRIYAVDPYAPWEVTFQAVANALTTYHQKDIDRYAEAHSGRTLGRGPFLTASNAIFASQSHAPKRPSPNNGDSRPTRRETIQPLSFRSSRSSCAEVLSMSPTDSYYRIRSHHYN